MDKEYIVPEKDKELTEILESKEETVNNSIDSIDIDLPKDKNKYKKGVAVASAALLGITGIGASAMNVKRSVDDVVGYTESLITETPTYAEPEIDLEKPYVSGGRIIKTSYEVEASSYVQVFQSSTKPESINDVTIFDFNTPEYSKSLYIPESEIYTYIPLDISTADPSLECTNFRMSPKYAKDNVTRKIQEGEKVYIKPGPVKRTDDECWFEAFYPEGEKLIKGYYCIVDEEQENKYVNFNTDDVFFYSYVVDDTRLYSKDEMLSMYYKVTKNDGIPFSQTPGDLENFSYLPYGTIIQGTTNTDIKKSSEIDQYAWLQCVAEIDGEKKVGYVPYKRTNNEPFLQRIPQEDLYISNENKTR